MFDVLVMFVHRQRAHTDGASVIKGNSAHICPARAPPELCKERIQRENIQFWERIQRFERHQSGDGNME